MSEPPTQQYQCPICQLDMLFEDSESRFRCPECGTTIELDDEAPGEEPSDTE